MSGAADAGTCKFFEAPAANGCQSAGYWAGGESSRMRVSVGIAGAALALMAISIGLCLWQLWVPNTHSPAHYDDVRDAVRSRFGRSRTNA